MNRIAREDHKESLVSITLIWGEGPFGER